MEALLPILNQLCVQTPKLSIRQAGAKGRGVFSTQFIPRGTMLAECFPIASRQYAPLKGVANPCSHCGNSCTSSCILCINEKPLVDQINTFEEKMAKFTHLSKFEHITAKIAFRVCTEARNGYENTNTLVSSLVYPKISDDIKNSYRRPCEDLKDLIIDAGYKDEVAKYINFDWYIRTLGVVHLNAIGTPSSCCLYDLPSFINHSCESNVGMRFRGSVGELVTLRELKEDEELFMNYIELDSVGLSFEQSQAFLRENYGFDCSATCSCPRKNIGRGKNKKKK